MLDAGHHGRLRRLRGQQNAFFVLAFLGST